MGLLGLANLYGWCKQEMGMSASCTTLPYRCDPPKWKATENVLDIFFSWCQRDFKSRGGHIKGTLKATSKVV